MVPNLTLPGGHTQTTVEDGSKSPAVSSLKAKCLLTMSMHILLLLRVYAIGAKLRVFLISVPRFIYWYQGVLRTQRRVNPASVRILMEAASASRTVSFTDCIRFWALWTSMSVAWSGKHLEVKQLGGKQQQRWDKMKLAVVEEVFRSCTSVKEKDCLY